MKKKEIIEMLKTIQSLLPDKWEQHDGNVNCFYAHMFIEMKIKKLKGFKPLTEAEVNALLRGS